MPDTAQIGSQMKGVALVTFAVMFFALADAATKHLTMLYAVPLVVAPRYLVNLILLGAVLAPRHGVVDGRRAFAGWLGLAGVAVALRVQFAKGQDTPVAMLEPAD